MYQLIQVDDLKYGVYQSASSCWLCSWTTFFKSKGHVFTLLPFGILFTSFSRSARLLRTFNIYFHDRRVHSKLYWLWGFWCGMPGSGVAKRGGSLSAAQLAEVLHGLKSRSTTGSTAVESGGSSSGKIRLDSLRFGWVRPTSKGLYAYKHTCVNLHVIYCNLFIYFDVSDVSNLIPNKACNYCCVLNYEFDFWKSRIGCS